MPRAAVESRATTAGKWLLAFVVPASGLLLGSLPIEALIAMSALAALACALLWIDRDARTSTASRWVLIALGVLLGMTLLQIVPLPAAWSRALSPATADIWDRALAPLHQAGPAWHPLTIAPPATHVEVLRGFFYACVFLGGLRVATEEHGERFLVRLIVVSSVLMALAALAHAAVGAEKVFGVYRPRELYAYQGGRFGPLLNINHLAAYLNLGACVALGALLGPSSMPRALSGSALLVLAGTSVWQSSRGATATLCLGIVLTYLLTRGAKRRFDSARASAAILAGCALAATVVVTVALSGSRAHLVSRDFTKVDVARSSMDLVAASPWFGVGRGGFESVFSSVREGTMYVTYNHPEDFVVQWLVEWGVPISVVGVALLGWALRPQIVLRAVRPAIGAWVAIVVGVLHELVDYHFEVPGIVALVVLCVAIVVSGRAQSRAAGHLASSSSVRVVAFAVAIGTLLAVVGVLPAVGHTLAEERRSLSAAAVDKTMSRADFGELVRSSMLRYPAEPFLPLMGAVRAQANGEGSVVPWVARAIERNPRFGRAHFVLAESLAPGHKAQARLEYRLAYENDLALRDAIVKEAVHVVDDTSSALELVPGGSAGRDMLEALIPSLASRVPSTAVILDRELESRAPGATAPLRRRADAAVTDAVTDAPWCARGTECITSALAAAEQLAHREPDKCHGHVLVARVRVKKGEAAAALEELDKSLDVSSERSSCQREFIALAFEAGQTRRGDDSLDKLVRAGCGATAECLDLYTWAAVTEEGRGHWVRAARLYRRVLDITPDRDDLLVHIGEMGSRDGLLADALEAYGQLATRHPSDPQWPARLAELRSRADPRRRTPPVP